MSEDKEIANASPFVSPRNTPVPRSRSNIANVYRSSRNNLKPFSRSNSCNATYLSKNNSDAIDTTFRVPTSTNETNKFLPSTLVAGESRTADKIFGSNKAAQVQVDTSNIGSITLGPDDNSKTLSCTSLLSDVNPQKQLLINYPSQENLLEIKNLNSKPTSANKPTTTTTTVISKPADQEISELLNSVKQYNYSNNENYCRSQSVPLHRMFNPTLMSPISNQFYSNTNSFNQSTSSSLVHTPVPSEFDDFVSITGQSDSYLLDQVDANFINDDQQFLIEDKTISSENINKIFDLLDDDDDDNNDKGLNNILNQQNNDEEDDDSGLIVLDSLPSDSINLQDTMLDPSTVDSFQKIIIQQQHHRHHQLQSRSYPNTPLPNSITPTAYHQSFTEDSNGPRSYPPTPISSSHIGSQDIYHETNEPMLSSPTLNSLNLHSTEHGNNDPTDSVCRNVSDLLETNFLTDGDPDDGLDPLTNFDGLQDVDSLAPLFNEVSDTNR
ncbi:Protein of unknown function [Cotesia congregata]|uniref:Uncharacterized protein n=1 Tax=Cotesia congregata TaxID=51543 RepID=A0A8J2HD24_COTCN|nr:Protein of unknown function [Cotesia congregata]